MRFLSALVAIAVTVLPQALAATAGCGKNPPSAGTKTITVNGKQRQYILTMPPNYDRSKEYNLIFSYHWLNGAATDLAHGRADQHYGLYALAGGNSIFVAPQGLNAGWANNGGEDVTFFDLMLAELENNLCINEKRRFSNGFSFGGAMSFSLACSRADKLAAVAIYSGAQLSGCSGGTTPIPFFSAHGVSDNVLNISQGRALRDKFLQLNGCQSANAREPSTGSNQWFKTEYQCRAGYPVTYISFDDGHTATPKNGGAQWMPKEVWTFFSQFMTSTGSPSTTTPGSTPTSTPTTPTSTPVVTPTQNPGTGQTVAVWGQCGGIGYNGSTTCASGATCKKSNDWYSQCVPS
jgi:poly(3-hydroxybutyrate) depolymerase